MGAVAPATGVGAGPAAGVVDDGEDVEVWILVEHVDGHTDTVGEDLTLPAGTPKRGTMPSSTC